MRRYLWGLVAFTVVLLSAPTTHATGPLGKQGQPISTSSYAIDLFQGPLLAGSRTIGLGGAMAGLAEGVDSVAVNPAAPSVRMPWSVEALDYAVTMGATFPQSLKDTDFDNNGTTGFTYNRFLFFTAGAQLQLYKWGIGITYDLQHYELQDLVSPDVDYPEIKTLIHRAHIVLSRSFANREIMIGVGFRLAALAVDEVSAGSEAHMRELFSTVGISPEAGGVWAPHALPLRIGLVGRLGLRSKTTPQAVLTANSNGDTIVDTMMLPNHVALPWEIEAGIAVQSGARPLNPTIGKVEELIAPIVQEIEKNRARRNDKKLSKTEERELRTAEEDLLKKEKAKATARLRAQAATHPRQKILVSAALTVSGAVDQAVGVESFLSGVVDRSGEKVVFVPRIGIEFEPIANKLQTRAGMYLEPTRFRDGAPRMHGTAGLDLNLFCSSIWGLFSENRCWKMTGVIDITHNYRSWGVSFGVWH